MCKEIHWLMIARDPDGGWALLSIACGRLASDTLTATYDQANGSPFRILFQLILLMHDRRCTEDYRMLKTKKQRNSRACIEYYRLLKTKKIVLPTRILLHNSTSVTCGRFFGKRKHLVYFTHKIAEGVNAMLICAMWSHFSLFIDISAARDTMYDWASDMQLASI
jgi:hypothetical protein